MIGGGFASETRTDSTGDDGVEVGSSGSASLLDVTPLSGFPGADNDTELPTASKALLPDDEAAFWNRADTRPGSGGTCGPSIGMAFPLLLEQSVS